MKQFSGAFKIHRKRFLTAAGLFATAAWVVLVAPVAFSLARAAQSQTAPQTQAPQQAPAADDPKFAPFVFDIVSIKPHKDDPNATSKWMGIQNEPDGATMREIPAIFIISQAFGTIHFKLSGAPDWASRDKYDIDAKMEPDVADALNKLSPEDQKLARKHMMLVLARDYLKASVHMDVTEVSIYELVVAKNGPKVTEVTDPAIPSGGLRVRGSKTGTTWEGHATPIANMMGQLSYAAGRPVYDKTGLTGRYDFTMTYMQENLSAAPPSADGGAPPPPDTAPPLARALEEQLGLKLVSAKGNMDVIVIDHIEKPLGN